MYRRLKFPEIFNRRMSTDDVKVIDELRRSPEWASLTQRSYRERLERRQALCRESKIRQAMLEKRRAMLEPKCAAANERVSRAEAELRAARLAQAETTQQELAVRAALGQEREQLSIALRANSDERIGLVAFIAGELQEVVRHTVDSWPVHVKNWLGSRTLQFDSNAAEIEPVLQKLRAIASEMRDLAEAPYPEDLLERLATHGATLHEIAKKFDVASEFLDELKEISSSNSPVAAQPSSRLAEEGAQS